MPPPFFELLKRFRSVGSTRSRAVPQRVVAGHVFAGEDAIAEAAVHAEDFVVSEARLENQLGDDVRRRVEGVVGSRAASGCSRSRAAVDAVEQVVTAEL